MFLSLFDVPWLRFNGPLMSTAQLVRQTHQVHISGDTFRHCTLKSQPLQTRWVGSLAYDKKMTILRTVRAVKVLIYLVCVPTLCRIYELPTVQCFPSVSHGCFLSLMSHSVGKTKMAISKVSNKLSVHWYFTNCATEVDIKEAEGYRCSSRTIPLDHSGGRRDAVKT